MRYKHWTEESVAAFAYRIASDFVEQLERKRESLNWSKRRLARELKLSPGRISQVINDPGNLTLELMVKVARALQMKVSILAYEDGDKENFRGPINADVFRSCWEKRGKPNGKWELDMAVTIDNMFEPYARMQQESTRENQFYGGADTDYLQVSGVSRSASATRERS
jgi:transcriptional regulator with XRE-family HTH domain